MTIKVISTGWSCQDWIMQTLRSVEQQSYDDWEILITYDGGDYGGALIRDWCDTENAHDSRWRYIINDYQMFAPFNQFRAITELAPADDDIVVFLDLDGDMLAHPDVFLHLQHYYEDGPLLTYGSYRSIPATNESPLVLPFPPDVVANNSYRSYILYGGPCSFNHLRTMKGKIAKAIPPDSGKWPDGRWFISGSDYLMMVSGLELAGGRYKVIEETLLLYNNANPRADNLSHPTETTACNAHFLRQEPLLPLP